MTTSGAFRSTADLLIYCDLCFWEGFTEAIEDTEDMTLTWVCPGCGHEETENLR